MRILKYIFLLLLLAMIGITVYVATQNGNFEVTRSTVVKAQRSTVFDFVNDYKNWETFGSWIKKDSGVKFSYPDKTIGYGAKCFWENSSDTGDIRTVFVKENYTITQKASFNRAQSTIYWTFKDTIGGTKVIIHSKGELDIVTKIVA